MVQFDETQTGELEHDLFFDRGLKAVPPQLIVELILGADKPFGVHNILCSDTALTLYGRSQH